MRKANEREQKIYQAYAKVAGRKQSGCSASIFRSPGRSGFRRFEGQYGKAEAHGCSHKPKACFRPTHTDHTPNLLS